MVLNILTSRASGRARCSCSARESVSLTNSDGGKPWLESSAFEVSITTFPFSAGPTACRAASEPSPLVALTKTSPSRSAYATSGRSTPAHSSRVLVCSGSRVPRLT